MATQKIGAEITANFTGNNIVLKGKKFDDAGTATIEIDGKDVGNIDEYSATRNVPFE